MSEISISTHLQESPGTEGRNILPAGYERRNPYHPLRRQQDYLPDGIRRRTWGRSERRCRLTYRRHPVAIILCTLAVVMSSSALAWGAPRVGSIYTEGAFAESGWASCSTPITWTIDTTNLLPAQHAVIRKDLEFAFNAWAQVSGLRFAARGESSVVYDNAASSVRPVLDLDRNIAVYFVPDSESAMITKRVVGYGSPSRIILESKEIVGSYMVISSDFLKSSNRQARRAIFMHEAGHALGLAHSDDPNSVMYPYTDETRQLGAADIDGLRAIEKVCGVV